MEAFKKYYSKLFHKQWGIGIAKESLEEIIRQKKSSLSFTWLRPKDINTSYADPFAFDNGNNVGVLFEKFTADKYDGEICHLTYNVKDGFSPLKSVLKNDFHLSYPYIFYENDEMYVLPESAFSGSVWCYKYDKSLDLLIEKREICKLPLLDATILKRDNKYWLFGTLLGKNKYNQLYVYYSDSIFGPYVPHAKNPVKDNLDGSRPAGSFFAVDGRVYRPAQNCKIFYGESITINRLEVLTTEEYIESEYLILRVDKSDEFSFGIHTINACGPYVVVDGLKGYFQPINRIAEMIKRKFLKK